MMTSILLALAMAAPSPGRCRPDRDGYCTAKVVIHRLSYAERDTDLRINTWVGSVVSVEFPKVTAFSAPPAVGNGAYFQVEYREADDAVQRLLIRPQIPATALRSGTPVRAFYGTATNIQVFLKGAPTVNLRVRLGPERTGVSKVKMRFPARLREVRVRDAEMARLRETLEAEHLKRQAHLDAEVEARATETLLDGMLTRFDCRDLSGRSMRDFLILRSRGICRIGDQIVLRLEIKNRKRGSVFHLERLEVRETGDTEPGPISNVVVRTLTPDPAVPFDQSIPLAVALTPEPTEGALGPWDLELIEDGGRNRRVVLKGVGF